MIIAHAPLAGALRAVAEHTFAEKMDRVVALDIERDAVPEAMVLRARMLISELGEAEVLLLSDVYGATPFNVGRELADGVNLRLVTGVNVPMLWRALCYIDEPLAKLVDRAVDGATQGVMQVNSPRPQNQTSRNPSDDQDPRQHQQ